MQMAEMNKSAKIDRVPEERVASLFLERTFGIADSFVAETYLVRLLRRLKEHLTLVALSLAAAIIVSVPLGIVASRSPRLGSLILSAAGVIQTIPSLALLVFMIPWLGIGAKPALVALFLYSLLPIVRNTATGLGDIPISLRESALALGLPPAARLVKIELPMASRDPRRHQDSRRDQCRHRHDRRVDRRRRVRAANPDRHSSGRRTHDLHRRRHPGSRSRRGRPGVVRPRRAISCPQRAETLITQLSHIGQQNSFSRQSTVAKAQIRRAQLAAQSA